MNKLTNQRTITVYPNGKPIKMLCLFDYKANTGYGTVSRNLVAHWKKAFGRRLILDICAINYFGDMYQEDEQTTVFSAIKSAPVDYIDDFGRNGFLKILQDSGDYDAIFILQDVGVVLPFVEVLHKVKTKLRQQNKKSFKSFFYFPVDAEFKAEQLVKGLEFFDGVVTYNEFGRQQVCRLRPELRKKLRVIPHGANLKDFRPLPFDEKEAFRKEYFGKNADKFIIVNLNRSQPRKDIGTTIFGFIEYKKTNPDSFLYLHMHPHDKPVGLDLRAVLMQTDLKEGEDFMFPPDSTGNAATVEQVNKIYNACDVYLTTARGEGWGLGVTEAMAAKLPVICPMNTSFFEIGDNGNRVYSLETQIPVVDRQDNIIRGMCDYREVAEVLDVAYQDLVRLFVEPFTMRHKLSRAYDYVQTLSWERVGDKWVEMIKALV
jgi:glycosyltransferase involved in cell wall biosynthesis